MLSFLLLLVPTLAAFLVLLLKKQGFKIIAVSASLIQLGLTLYAFKDNSAILFYQPWIATWGASFHLELDGLSKLMVLLTNALMPLILLSAWRKSYNNVFYMLVLLMQMALNGVFMAQDGLLFYIFWEIALIPIYFICLFWGGENRARITFKFFVYTLAGSLMMLLGLLYLYFHTGVDTYSFDIMALYEAGRNLPATEQSWVFWAIFLAFAIKIPIFPFHSWQPDTYTTAPTPGVMLLSGIMLKMGTFGLIKWLMPMVPLAWQHWSMTAMILSVIGVIYASCIAIVQKDYKRLLAYSSMAHVGLISAGIFSSTEIGLQGAVFQMLSHGIIVIGLFFIIEIIESRLQSREITLMGGLRNVSPLFALLFLLILLGSVALPLTNGFVGEFMLITGIFQYNPWIAGFAGLTIILGAVYMLRSYQQIALGDSNAFTSSFGLLKNDEIFILALIIAVIFVFGLFPNLLLQSSEESISSLLKIYQYGTQ